MVFAAFGGFAHRRIFPQRTCRQHKAAANLMRRCHGNDNHIFWSATPIFKIVSPLSLISPSRPTRIAIPCHQATRSKYRVRVSVYVLLLEIYLYFETLSSLGTHRINFPIVEVQNSFNSDQFSGAPNCDTRFPSLVTIIIYYGAFKGSQNVFTIQGCEFECQMLFTKRCCRVAHSKATTLQRAKT